MIKLGLLGHQIHYSLSPKLHQMIASTQKLSCQYQLFDVEENQVETILDLVRKQVIQGLNVTKPYKKVVIPYLDGLSEIARKVQAVNTIYLKDGKLIGDNTDYQGFIDLIALNQIDMKDQHVYILGAGGAANAVYEALKGLGAIVKVVKHQKVPSYPFETIIEKQDIDVNWVDIFVQATPVGTHPNIDESFIDVKMVQNKMVIDLIYQPQETKLMHYAKEKYNGLDMLICQAIESQALFLGKKANKNKGLILKIKEGLLK